MDEVEELVRLNGRATLAMMGEVPGFELHMARNCVLGLTGEPLADFNTLCMGPHPEAAEFLVRSVTRVKARGLPLVAIFSPHVARALAPLASGLGLTAAGTAPLMVLRAGRANAARPRAGICRALGPELVRVAGDLASAAFDLPRDAVARCVDVGITQTAGVETWILWSDDQPMSAVSVTPAGDTAGICGMATPPKHQRKGFGRALLTGVVDRYRRLGVQRFYLVASDAGRPLYASLGFEPIADLSAWLLSR